MTRANAPKAENSARQDACRAWRIIRAGHHDLAPRCIRREHPVVEKQVDPRAGQQGDDALKQLDRVNTRCVVPSAHGRGSATAIRPSINRFSGVKASSRDRHDATKLPSLPRFRR